MRRSAPSAGVATCRSHHGRKREIDIEIGIVTQTETEITKGLKEGDRVIGQ